MDIVVLAGGLSTERDVSFKSGSMVTKALRENGHRVIMLDVFMGYSDKEEDLTGAFERAEEMSVSVSEISFSFNNYYEGAEYQDCDTIIF